MAKLSLTLNGQTVEKSLTTLELLFAVMATSNPAAQTVTAKVNAAIAKNPDYVLAVQTGGDSGDVFEISEDSILKARYTRLQLAEKIAIAANVANWQGEIFTEKSEKTPASKGDLETV